MAGQPELQQWPVTRLIPYARNARTHSDAQVAQIAASIKEFGFTNPILIDKDGGIIAGHGRVMAARKLGLTTVPVLMLGHLSETQKRAYIIAGNRLAETSTWDIELLALEIEDLRLDDFDIDLTGFDASALDALFADMEGVDGDGDLDTDGPANEPKGNLADRFMIPPFSVMNAREGWWQDRKRAWLALGIKSELGRGGGLIMEPEQVTSPGLNFYRDQAKQRQAVAPGQHVTIATGNVATAEDGL